MSKRSRSLRTYTRIAQIEHWCDRCCTYIQPGECYEGRVEATGKGTMIVWKEHINPRCELPPDPDQQDHDESEEDIPLAA